MPYSTKDHWDTLQKELDKYDKNNLTKSSGAADELSYMAQRQYLGNLIKLGLEIEGTSTTFHPQIKMRLGLAMNKMTEVGIGTEDFMPRLDGPKSFEFATKVYLPFLKRGQDLQFNSVQIFFAQNMGIDVIKGKEESNDLIKKLEIKLENFMAFYSIDNSKPVLLSSPSSSTAEPVIHQEKSALFSCGATLFVPSTLSTPHQSDQKNNQDQAKSILGVKP